MTGYHSGWRGVILGKPSHGTGGHSAAPQRTQSFAGSVDKMQFHAKRLQKLGILILGKLQPMQTNALSLSHCFNTHPAFGGNCNGPSPAEFVILKEIMFICPKLTCLGLRDQQQHECDSQHISIKPCLTQSVCCAVGSACGSV